MGLMDEVVSGRIKVPDRITIYGADGVGKSTFASKAPKPIFIGPESGTANLDVRRWKNIRSLGDIAKRLHALGTEKHDYQTVVLDSADWIEPLIWEQVCLAEGGTSIENVGGGYGKGYVAALGLWRNMLQTLEKLQAERNMGVIFIAHAEIKAFNDPSTNSTYDRYQLKLNAKAAAILREWSHVVLFAAYQVFTKGKENAKHKAFGDGTRRMYSERRPAFDAKTRYAIPFELELDYEAYRQAVDAGPEAQATAVKTNIEELLTLTQDQELIGKVRAVVEKAGNNVQDLLLVQNKLRARLGKEEDGNGRTGN